MMETSRLLKIRHTNHYHYDAPIRRSTHRLHLRPIDEWRQSVSAFCLSVTPAVPVIECEDVFGNWAQRFDIDEPYTDLVITAESEVELCDLDPFAFARLPIRPASFPLVWMPWERTMLAPYLTPVELPDTQLRELSDYGMGFVKRSGGDLIQTLLAMNLSLYQDYEYTPGSTDLDTTPYRVYCKRAGVCQDFANLFITVARLMGIPARYVCGYLYTGNTGRSRARSDATHAWVQLYIPNIGWKGFDPTNGVLPRADHVRVAYGRHYRDTSPTAGTLYGGGGACETLRIDVEVSDVAKGEPASSRPDDGAPPAAGRLLRSTSREEAVAALAG